MVASEGLEKKSKKGLPGILELGPRFSVGAKGAESGGKGRQIQRPFYSDVHRDSPYFGQSKVSLRITVQSPSVMLHVPDIAGTVRCHAAAVYRKWEEDWTSGILRSTAKSSTELRDCEFTTTESSAILDKEHFTRKRAIVNITPAFCYLLTFFSKCHCPVTDSLIFLRAGCSKSASDLGRSRCSRSLAQMTKNDIYRNRILS